MTQPEALRLAEWLEGDGGGLTTLGDCAAELRRQHEENERVFKLADDQDSVIRRQRTERQTLEAQRDALLEALWVCMEHNRLHHGDSHNTVIQARAAIKAVEENT